MAENLQLMARLYPGWVMRLYVSSARLDNSSVETLCDIQCNNTFGNPYVKITRRNTSTYTFYIDFFFFPLLTSGWTCVPWRVCLARAG